MFCRLFPTRSVTPNRSADSFGRESAGNGNSRTWLSALRPGAKNSAAAMLIFMAQFARAFQADTPVTPGSSPETQALLNFFADIYGKKIVAGQHDGWRFTNGLSEELSYIEKTTGKLPAILEMDVSGCTATNRDTNHRLMKHALDWAQSRHGVVAFCWHWRAPMNQPAFYTKETTFDISRAVTPGTPEYAATERDLDLIAGELEMLRDAHLPVLWRPLHEANGRWFWWGNGGPEPFKKLWRMMFENFTAKHHLDNLLWEFSPGAETELAAWYPGDAFVDIIGQDHYPMDGNHNSAKDIFDELTLLTRGQKLVGLGENGPIPDPALLAKDHAGWLFFTTWSGSILFEKTTAAQLREYYHEPYVLTLTNLPELKDFSASSVGPPAKLEFLGAPGNVAVGGTRRMPLAVAVRDENGKTVRAGNFSVTLALEKFGGAKLSGRLTATTTNGVATFADANIDTPVSDCRLIAAAEHLQLGTSAAFSVDWQRTAARAVGRRRCDFSKPPARKAILSAALETPVQLATNFSARIRGWLIAPQTGEYIFSVANAAESELWLSTDTSPTNAAEIVVVDNFTPYRKWPHINESDSAAINLVAGQKYYFEIRQWQPAGSTQLRVRWQLPDGTCESPIPAFRFASQKF